MSLYPLCDLPLKGKSTGFFFSLVLGITYAFQLPAVLALHGIVPGRVESYMLLAMLGVFSPLVVALISAWRENRKNGIRCVFSSPRNKLHWYVIALGMFGAIHLIGTIFYKLLGGSDEHWLFLPSNAQHIVAMLMVPIAEEPGWRGYALPRLQARFGAIKASLVLGILWALWHTLMFILQGMTLPIFFIAMINIIAGSVVFSWLYNRTKGNLLIAIFAHIGAHLDNPTRALPDNPVPFLVFTIAVCLTASVLILSDREAWKGSMVIKS